MKKIFMFIVSALLMVSCGEDLEFNTPALQGKKDGAQWRADYYSAEINSSGQLIINGGRGSESVSLKMGSANVGTYVLGEGSSSEAIFTSVQDVAHSTNNEPDPSVQIYPADGEIVITSYSDSGSKVSGTFWFNAFSESGLNKVNYSQGVFYEIPIAGGGTSSTVVSCDNAVIATATAATNYTAVTITDPEYTSLCNAYATALAQQIVSCGDDTGVLQGLIDGLDCDPTGSDYWPRAINNSWTYNTAVNGEQTYEITGTETIEGLDYYVFDDLFGVPSWLRKDGPNYYVRARFSGSIPGYQFMSTPFTVNMIKDDAIVGETWESDASYTISYTPDPGQIAIPDADVSATYSFEMMGRDLSRTVEGVDYNDVIHIELVASGVGLTVTTQYYYSNNIGLIEYITSDGSNALSSYMLN